MPIPRSSKVGEARQEFCNGRPSEHLLFAFICRKQMVKYFAGMAKAGPNWAVFVYECPDWADVSSHDEKQAVFYKPTATLVEYIPCEEFLELYGRESKSSDTDGAEPSGSGSQKAMFSFPAGKLNWSRSPYGDTKTLRSRPVWEDTSLGIAS